MSLLIEISHTLRCCLISSLILEANLTFWKYWADISNNSCKLDDFDLRRQISGFSSFYCFLPTKLPSWSRPRSAVGPLFHYLASWLAGSSHSTKPMRLVGHSVWYQIITVGFDVMASLALTQYIGEELTAPKLVRPNTYSTFFSALRVYWKPSIFFVCLLR